MSADPQDVPAEPALAAAPIDAEESVPAVSAPAADADSTAGEPPIAAITAARTVAVVLAEAAEVARPSEQTPAGWSDHAAPYETWAAPLDARYAADVVAELELGPDVRLLDVATGTGALALAAAQAGATVTAVDFAPGMVEALDRRATDLGLDVRTAVMDGQALDLPDRAFDAAASMLGLMFFPDMAAGARELRRVLRLGGRAAAVTWALDGFTVMRLAREAIASTGPVVEPRDLPPVLRLSDPAVLEMLLQDAGFVSVSVRALAHAWPVGDAAALFRSIPTWSAPMRPLFTDLDAARLEDAAGAFAALVAEHAGPEGLPTRMLLGTGTR